MKPTRLFAAAVVLALMGAGCSSSGTQTQTTERPAASNPAVAPAPAPAASAPAAKSAPALVREAVEGGFRIGPFGFLRVDRWGGSDRILGLFGSAPGTIALKGGLVDPIPGASYDFMEQSMSPDLTRMVVYGKYGPDKFVDLSTGASRVVEATGYYGSLLLDAWSPDGRSYLIHAPIGHAVPGFFFLDAGGRTVRTFHEPGFYSHRGVWSPDGKQVAFLSSPSATPYPDYPESPGEPPFGPRLGLLDVAAGKARYVEIGKGEVARGQAAWSPDGKQVAVTCGELAIEKRSVPDWTGEVAVVRNSRICVIDAATGKIRRMGQAEAPNEIPAPVAWSPDGTGLLVERWSDHGEKQRFALFNPGDGSAVNLPGLETRWVDANRLVTVIDRQKAVLIDRKGTVLKTLASGTEVRDPFPSPDGAHVAMAIATGRTGYYLVVLPTK